jgi:hypothetical protein
MRIAFGVGGEVRTATHRTEGTIRWRLKPALAASQSLSRATFGTECGLSWARVMALGTVHAHSSVVSRISRKRPSMVGTLLAPRESASRYQNRARIRCIQTNARTGLVCFLRWQSAAPDPQGCQAVWVSEDLSSEALLQTCPLYTLWHTMARTSRPPQRCWQHPCPPASPTQPPCRTESRCVVYEHMLGMKGRQV